jgi:hypothetical protein
MEKEKKLELLRDLGEALIEAIDNYSEKVTSNDYEIKRICGEIAGTFKDYAFNQ